MPESFTPKEINDYINSHNKGPKFDPYGSEELSNRLRTNKAEAGDIFAQAEQTLDEDKALEKAKALAAEQAKQAEIDKAQQALLEFRNYLAQSTGKAAQALPVDYQLVYNYNPDTQQCEITYLDGEDMTLDISYSGLSGELLLPPQLMVTALNCNRNQLTTLPEVLPTSMTWFNCSNNQLTTLPELCTSLTGLNCDSNQLTALPELPASLTRLHCSNNQLTALPELPVSLSVLTCSNNQLTALPELPASLTELDCSGNPDLDNNPAAQAALQALRDRGVKVTS